MTEPRQPSYVKTLVEALFWGGVVWIGGSLLAVLLASTLVSAFKGENSKPGYDAVAGTAQVETCVEEGPVSGYGFGYYWTCDVSIWLADGRRVNTVLERSIVTPDDRGRPVPVVELCPRPGAPVADCRYSQPGGRALGVLIRLVAFGVRILAVFGFLLGGAFLLRGILGRRASMWLFRQKAKPTAAPTEGSSSG